MGVCQSQAAIQSIDMVVSTLPGEYKSGATEHEEFKSYLTSAEMFIMQRTCAPIDRSINKHLFTRPSGCRLSAKSPDFILKRLRVLDHVVPPHILFGPHGFPIAQNDLHLLIQWPRERVPPRHFEWRYGHDAENLFANRARPMDVRIFEPRDYLRGRVARALAYFYMKYVNNPTLRQYGHQANAMTAGLASIIPIHLVLQWHEDYKITPDELRHHDQIESIQGDANPFVRHPEWLREHLTKQPVRDSNRKRCSKSCCVRDIERIPSARGASAVHIQRHHSIYNSESRPHESSSSASSSSDAPSRIVVEHKSRRWSRQRRPSLRPSSRRIAQEQQLPGIMPSPEVDPLQPDEEGRRHMELSALSPEPDTKSLPISCAEIHPTQHG